MGDQEQSSLQENIRAGKVPPIIKRRASRGTLPVSSDEMLEILIFLTKDPDPTCSEVAKETLKEWTLEKCAPILAQPHIAGDTLAYFGQQDNLPEELIDTIIHHPNANDLTFAAFAKRIKVPQIYELIPGRERALELPLFVTAVVQRNDIPSDFRKTLESALPKDAAPGAAGDAKKPDKDRKSTTAKIQEMGIPEKIAFSIKADREAILILIRDPAKMVYRAALTSPKLGDAEAETISSLKNVSDEVLRELGSNRKFLKNHVVVRNLVNNPRTPVDISLTLIKLLQKAELKGVMANRNISEILRKMATKLVKGN
jgi:hypothetical protein